MQELSKKFFELFQGAVNAYGTYVIQGKEDNKLVGKATTLRKPVTLELWQQHLEGKQGLGIIPINEDSKCLFGAIDIDEYPIDYVKVASKVRELGLPLLPCKSKSGGLHLYLFLKDFTDAILVQNKLKEFAVKLGYGNCEIFPKQTVILKERGDLGQWINMPYYNCQDTDRPGIFPDGTIMDVQDFFAMVETLRLESKKLFEFKLDLINEVVDGPPCLQYLVTQKFSAGSRNNSMLNVGLYLKKVNEEKYASKMLEFNSLYFNPPLSSQEVVQIAGSLARKAYNYTCGKSPLKQHCNAELCRTRKYGIPALAVDNLKLENLSKYNTEPPIWFVNITGSTIRLELETEDLQNQTRFQKKCMEAANIYPPTISKNVWLAMIQELLQNVTIIEASKDTSPVGQFFEHLEKFCTARAQAKSREEILLGRPFENDGWHYFRLSDLITYLDRQHFKEFKLQKLASILRDFGGITESTTIKEKHVNIWSVPAFRKIKEGFDVKGLNKEATI